MQQACAGSFAQSSVIDWTQHDVGDRISLMRHGPCHCVTNCRRVALWVDGPVIEAADDWVVKAIARVGFGDACQGPEVEVDFKRGVILDLMGCWTSVAVEAVELVAGESGLPSIRYGALSSCCGAGGARGVATRTTGVITTVSGGFSQIVRVPPFAYAFYIVSSASPAGGVQILGSGTAAKLTDESLVEGLIYQLPGGSESISFFTGDAVDLETVFLIGV